MAQTRLASRRQVRPAPLHQRRPDASLRAALRRRSRAAGPRDSPRGLPVSPTRRLILVLGVLSAALFVADVVALFLGSAQLSPSVVLSAVSGRAAPESIERVVILSIRLPRIAAAVLAGGALAVAGVAFQALTRNPLAEPSVLGISAGAAFGVVIGQSFGLGLTLRAAVGLTAFAFAGALVAAG